MKNILCVFLLCFSVSLVGQVKFSSLSEQSINDNTEFLVGQGNSAKKVNYRNLRDSIVLSMYPTIVNGLVETNNAAIFRRKLVKEPNGIISYIDSNGTRYKLNEQKDSISTNYGLLNFRNALNDSALVNIMILGDSRTQRGFLAKHLGKLLKYKFGDGGIGVLMFGLPYPLIENGLTYSTTGGTSELDYTGIATGSCIGQALSMPYNSSVTFNTSTISDGFGKFSTMDIFYPKQSTAYTFSVSIDGVSQSPFTTATGSGVGKVTYNVSDATHTVTITQTTNTSGAALYEANLKRSKGVIVHCVGNSGFTNAQLLATSSNSYLFSDVKPVLSIIRVGANNMAVSGEGTAATQIIGIAENIKASGGKDILVLGETDNTYQSVLVNAYNTAYQIAARINNYSYLNLKNVCNNFTSFINSGFANVGEDVHENSKGGQLFANYIFEGLFKNINEPLASAQIDNISNDGTKVIVTLPLEQSSASPTISLNSTNVSDKRSIRFKSSGFSYGSIDYYPSSGIMDLCSGNSPTYGGTINFKADSILMMSISRSAATMYNSFVVSSTNAASFTLYNSVTSAPVRLILDPRSEIQYTGTTAKLKIIAGVAANWGANIDFSIDGTSVGLWRSSGLTIGSGANNNSSSILDIISTTKGVLLPRMTTVERNAITPVEGLEIYNLTTHTKNYYNGSAWISY